MQTADFRKYSILGQIGIWLFLFLIFFSEEWEYYYRGEAIINAFLYMLFMTAMVYSHYFWILPLYLKGKRGLPILLSFFWINLFIVLMLVLMNALPFDNEPYTTIEYIDTHIYYFLLFTLIVGLTSLYYFIESWFKNIQRESQLKNEKLAAELNFLKSQINPHFLFNTLNNIYAYAQTGNPKTAPMLERLSSILRFMVYDCQAEKVALSKEIQAVEDLLEMYRMKNSEQQNIHLKVEGMKGYHLIAPLLIVNLVENAFKHSNALTSSNGYIKINITISNSDDCHCQITNSISNRTKQQSSQHGVGLKNIRQRLALQYPNRSSLEEEINSDRYQIDMYLPLERK